MFQNTGFGKVVNEKYEKVTLYHTIKTEMHLSGSDACCYFMWSNG
jgi:hypothetical protein